MLHPTVKRIFQNFEYKTILKNFGFLTVLQLSNYVLPLITLPFLANVLGAKDFGLLMFSQAVTQYFIIVIEYGFNFSATKEIAINRSDLKTLKEIFWDVIILKFLLLMASATTLAIAVTFFDRLNIHSALYYASISSMVGTFLFPNWFFQGIEKMQYITILTLGSRVIAAICIIIFVRDASDITLVPIFNGGFQTIAAIIGLIYAKSFFDHFSPVSLSLVSLKKRLLGGLSIFLSSVSSSLYGITNTFVLGLLFGDTAAGYYSFAEKVIRAFSALFIPFNNALYPFMSKKMESDRQHGLGLVKKILLITGSISFAMSIGIFFASDLLRYIISPDLYPSLGIIKTLSPLLIFIGLTNLLGFQVLLTTQNETTYLRVVALAGVINITLCFALSGTLSYYSAAASVLVAEAFVFFSFYNATKKLFISSQSLE